MSATSTRLGDRRSIRIEARWSSTPWNAASSSCMLLFTPASRSGDSVSGMPATQSPTTRTPCGPTSIARLRTNVSIAASAGPVLPIIGLLWAEPLLSARMTPEPRSTM